MTVVEVNGQSKGFSRFRDAIKKGLYRALDPLVNLLVRAGISPNLITFIGFAMNILAAGWFIWSAETATRMDLAKVGWGGFLILVAGVFDMLDGQVARKTRATSRFGALFDSVMDRYSELVMFLGICYYLVSYHYFLSSLFAFVALMGSMMVSYVRARAEGLGIQCSDGLMQRPERIITIGLAGILCGLVSGVFGTFYWRVDRLPFHLFENMSLFTLPIALLAVLANYTAISRLMHCRRQLG
ncbi:MAG: CDP-alcohol phosphatidyltransferase family protein [Saprospiraceae bacterium]|nr:CDP-alcohol phosphatidyltransferase family protein [Saprospiraceae bacterium]